MSHKGKSMSTRILIVDDEPDLVWALRYTLVDDGYEVSTASDGIEALSLARQNSPDLVILDIVMPNMNGVQVCSKLRRDPTLATVPILFLTMRSAIEDRITGLDGGGDDYLVKPFDLGELKARIRALLRRRSIPIPGIREQEDQHALLALGALRLDLHTRQVVVEEKTMQLTPAEFELLHFLFTHPGEIFSSQQLLQHVWNYSPDTADPGLVRWHIMNLRTKIEPDPTHPIYIRTVPHHGYILEKGS